MQTVAEIIPSGDVDVAYVVVSHTASPNDPSAAKQPITTRPAQPILACLRSDAVSSRFSAIAACYSGWRRSAIGAIQERLLSRECTNCQSRRSTAACDVLDHCIRQRIGKLEPDFLSTGPCNPAAERRETRHADRKERPDLHFHNEPHATADRRQIDKLSGDLFKGAAGNLDRHA